MLNLNMLHLNMYTRKTDEKRNFVKPLRHVLTGVLALAAAAAAIGCGKSGKIDSSTEQRPQLALEQLLSCTLQQADDFDTDIIEVLRESNKKIREQLEGLSRDDFSEVFLFFDYDAHQTNLGKSDDVDVINQMLESFDNETENGKLYISYPMVEALRDFEAGKCGNGDNCFVEISDLAEYKNISSRNSLNPHFRDYNIDVWKEIIDVFSMRISCLLGNAEVISYEQYLDEANPHDIFMCEQALAGNNKVFIISAFPEFLVDYFGMKLWRTCVKHAKNQLDICNCK